MASARGWPSVHLRLDSHLEGAFRPDLRSELPKPRWSCVAAGMQAADLAGPRCTPAAPALWTADFLHLTVSAICELILVTQEVGIYPAIN